MGECGQRGGFVEYVGFSEEVLQQFNKMAATSLASNTLGQAVPFRSDGDGPRRCGCRGRFAGGWIYV